MSNLLNLHVWPVIVTLFLVSAVLAGNPGGVGSSGDEGHWENLGEDGWIWVPAEAPSKTNLPDENLGDYHNYSQTAAVLADLADDRPDLFTLSDIGTSVQGRTIWMMSVSAPGDASERARLLFDGAHHGNEVIGAEALTRMLLQIEAEYDDDATMQAILDEVVLDVVPMVNVDGVVNIPNCGHYADCRKNANGVDLNRNYPANWGGTGSSGNPNDATYHGPAPLSEPEAQAVATLLDTHDYAQHATMHSGIELVLWPYGWTQDPPPEHALYQSLGSDLSTISGAPHGQASQILYFASGTTMDYAYGEAEGWRPVSFTPEVYQGSGGAFNWWLYFNPTESDAQIEPVLGPWIDMLWHLAAEAPDYAPASLVVPESLEFGPDPGLLEVTLEATEKRPFSGASLAFEASDAPVQVLSENPVQLQDGSHQQVVSFSLMPERGGEFTATLVLDGGPAGTLERDVHLNLSQIGMELSLQKEEMGSPEMNEARVLLDAGPFDSVSGTLNLSIEPSGSHVGEVPFQVAKDAPMLMTVAFDAESLAVGEHQMVATADFTAVYDGEEQEGWVQVQKDFTVLRPQITLDKRFAPQSPVGEPFSVLSIYRNTGNMAAESWVVEETVPPGYTYWFRDGPVPVPLDPLGAPPPDDIQVNLDGSMNVRWEMGTLEPGQQQSVNYRLVPLLAGEGILVSDWTYEGDFSEERVVYADTKAPVHEAG